MNKTLDTPILDVEIHQHQRALEFARRDKDLNKMVSALRELGQRYLKDGDAPKALTQFEEGIEVAEEADNQEEQARLWGYKGMALKEIGNFQMARNAYDKSNKLARELDHPILICDSLIRIGMLQAEAGEVTKGISKLEQAYAIAVEQSNAPRLVNIAMVLGNYFYQLESSAKAMEYYLDALGLSRERGDKPTECRILVACGNIQIQGEEFEVAHENFEKALKLASTLEDPEGQLGSLAGLMKTSAYKDNVELAEMYGEKALNLVSQLQDPKAELSVIESLVGLLVGHEKYTNALPHFERGLKLAAEHQDGDRRLNFLTGLAFAHYDLTELDRAQELYQELLDEAIRLQNPVAESTALGRLSAILTEQEDLQGALEHAQKALEKAHETENTALVAEQQVLAALAHRDLGDEEKASLYFKDAIAAYTGLGKDALAAQVKELGASG